MNCLVEHATRVDLSTLKKKDNKNLFLVLILCLNNSVLRNGVDVYMKMLVWLDKCKAKCV